MNSNEVRKIFLDYFKDNHHTYVPGCNVIPENDDSLLFINAGMNQFKSIFLDENIPDKFKCLKRACNYQRCIRAGGKHNDVDDVGADVYHHTLFEMLGSWSFNDYGNEEAIDMAWDLLINYYKINPDNLYVTYFEGDSKLSLNEDLDTINFWKKYLPENKIIKGSTKDNFWSMGDSGPCGTCTEIHYDRIGNRDASHLVNKDDPDVLEIWNIVSIGYNMKDNCKLENLNKKFIDTGMGFERLVSILQKKTSNYDTDIFTPIIEIIENETNVGKYTGQIDNDIGFKDMSYRVLADHLRTIIISINDGCIPSSNGRNYIVRKILRRAIFYGNKLSPDENFLSRIASKVIKVVSQNYKINSSNVINIIQDEELLFNRTLKNGKKLLNKHIKRERLKNILNGDIIFKLNTGAGLPLYIIEIICKEHNINIDYDNYYKLLKKHKT